jgi:3-dehydroquinate dehydratase
MSLKDISMIFVSISNPEINKCIELIEKYKNVELRLDLIKPDIDDIGLLVAKAECSICTYSDIFDPHKSYEYAVSSLELGADIVDFGLYNTPDMIRQVVALAKEKDKMVMLSYHNFEFTPESEYLEGLINEADSYQPDLIKIACLAKDEAESEKLLALMKKSDRVIPVPMGEEGRKGRLKAYFYGCPIIYAYPDGEKPTAPGQLPFSDFKDMDKILGVLHR